MTLLPPIIDQLKVSILPISKLKNDPVEGFRPAAVLMPLVLDNGVLKLLYIHRADTGGMHSGQVSFPGGGMESVDRNLVDTALRETEEEIGIHRETIEVLGYLPSITSVTGYQVTPIVGLVEWPQEMVVDKREVSRVFTIEVQWLNNPDHWQEKEVFLPVRGKANSIFFDEYDSEVLWGLTARMTLNLLKQR
jgi:8-oxo-dGTP pyrophosphatase MutT (NUDIX family)